MQCDDNDDDDVCVSVCVCVFVCVCDYHSLFGAESDNVQTKLFSCQPPNLFPAMTPYLLSLTHLNICHRTVYISEVLSGTHVK